MIRHLLILLSLVSCTSSSSISGTPRPGDLWSVKTDDGRYGVAKVLATDEGGVHLRLYSQRFEERPATVNPSELTLGSFGRGDATPFSIGHLPLSHRSFQDWEPELISHGAVSEEELEGYRVWQEAQGGYF
jgi:hypothetical protein